MTPARTAPGLRGLLMLAGIALVLAGCAQREDLVARPADREAVQLRTILVASTRAVDPETRRFTSDRGTGVTFARYVVSVPPDRRPGRVTRPLPQEIGDPNRHFLVDSARLFESRAAFVQELAPQLRADRHREAVIFVHGFNNTFAESLYRFAQISADLELPGVAIHYAWASAGNALVYARDRDSTLIARDGLEDLLRAVRSAGAQRIVLVAHSMGAHLVMETLRQMAIADGPGRTADLAVILVSPDIDLQVFRAQAERIGQLPQPFLIFASPSDAVLRLSALLTSEVARLGSLADMEALADLDVTVIDVSGFRDAQPHFVPATSPILLQLLSRVSEVDAALGDERARMGLLPGTVLTFRQATRIVLSPVAEVVVRTR